MIYFFLYNLVLLVSFPFISVYLFFASIFSNKWQGTLHERNGYYGKKFAAGGAKRIWVHAVSVGEVVGAILLVRLLMQRETDYEIVVSTTTRGGMEMLKRNFSGGVILFYFPLDFPWTIRRTLRTISPAAVVLMETEIWPNLLRACEASSISAILLNGRVSDRMAGAGWFVRGLYRWAFGRIAAAGMQSERDSERLALIASPRGEVVVTGNMKFDYLLAAAEGEKVQTLREVFDVENRRLFVAGSTHPGEDEIILDVYEKIIKVHGDIALVLCPRHVERADEVVQLVIARGLQVVKRSKITPNHEPRTANKGRNAIPTVIVIDTIGELRLLYGIATVCFVGGSLVPRGGHNVLEPAACGKAPFYGQFTQNFLSAVETLENYKGGIMASDGDELAEKVLYYLNNKDYMREIDGNARKAVEANTGAVDRAYALLKKHLVINNK